MRSIRRFSLVAVALIAGCVVATPVAPVAPVPPVAPGHIYAVLKLVDVSEEMSNLGGKHYTFVVDEPAHRVIHAGGHAISTQLPGTYESGGMMFGMNVSGPAMWTQLPGPYFVADVDLGAQPFVGGLGHSDQVPGYVGEATRFVAASDLADARHRLATIRSTGWPASSLTLHY